MCMKVIGAKPLIYVIKVNFEWTFNKYRDICVCVSVQTVKILILTT